MTAVTVTTACTSLTMHENLVRLGALPWRVFGPLRHELSVEIQRARRARWSYAELAEVIGADRRTVKRLEKEVA